MFVNDRLPLWICKRYRNGVWQPELRLYVMAITAVFTPVGLGICGAALKHHYHYMVFALGYFIVAVSVLIAVPVATNYVAESFTQYGTECTLVMTFYRLAWGVAIPFFVEKWIEKVGIEWVYGTAAFITIGSWAFIQVLLWKGDELRNLSLVKSMMSSEGGQTLFEH
jgi:MFS family permease